MLMYCISVSIAMRVLFFTYRAAVGQLMGKSPEGIIVSLVPLIYFNWLSVCLSLLPQSAGSIMSSFI